MVGTRKELEAKHNRFLLPTCGGRLCWRGPRRGETRRGSLTQERKREKFATKKGREKRQEAGEKEVPVTVEEKKGGVGWEGGACSSTKEGPRQRTED